MNINENEKGQNRRNLDGKFKLIITMRKFSSLIYQQNAVNEPC